MEEEERKRDTCRRDFLMEQLQGPIATETETGRTGIWMAKARVRSRQRDSGRGRGPGQYTVTREEWEGQTKEETST